MWLRFDVHGSQDVGLRLGGLGDGLTDQIDDSKF